MDKYQALFPMAYLVISIIAAVGFHYVGVPDTVGGIIIGAAITRVKMPNVQPKEPERNPDPEINI